MDIRWGFGFRKGELQYERPQSTYVLEPSVVPATQKPEGQEQLKLGSAAMNTKGRRTYRQDPNSHRLQGREERGASQANWGSKLHPLCLSDSSTPTTHMLETIAAFRVMSTSETFQGSAGIWMLGSAQQINLSHLMLRVSAIFFVLEHLSPPDGKILILMKTEKQFKKTRNRKKMRPSCQVERKSTHFP